MTLFIWIPNDIETGVIETFRRRVTIGDAMAPTMMAIGILTVSILMGVLAIVRPEPYSKGVKEGLDKHSLSFLLRLTIAIGLGLALMIHTGPLVVDLVNLLGGDLGSYRLQKATFPYKYIGYITGGFVMVFGVIRVVENRFTASAAWVSIFAVIVMTILYDVPFDNLLLPPNGN
ncbi:MAG: hypothetical protein HN731_08280 [Rhodospirillaceae bacterium]|nr:hypothetical protein [Rhodospirillaceae bacterium]